MEEALAESGEGVDRVVSIVQDMRRLSEGGEIVQTRVDLAGLLQRAKNGITRDLVEDHPLDTREDTDAFMEKHGVETTPQTFIGDERIGGYDDLRVFFDIDPPEEEQSDTTYQPVIAIFSVAALLALGLSWHQYGSVLTLRGFEWFISLSMKKFATSMQTDHY